MIVTKTFILTMIAMSAMYAAARIDCSHMNYAYSGSRSTDYGSIQNARKKNRRAKIKRRN